MRKDFEEHVKNCEYREVLCKWCDNKIMKIKLSNHEEDECDLIKVKCENYNKGCI